MVEIEEAEGLLALEESAALAMKRHQRGGRIEQPAEVVSDSRPAAVDAAVEAFAGKDVAAAEAVTGLEHDALIVPRGGEHWPQSRLRQLEIRQLTVETNRG